MICEHAIRHRLYADDSQLYVSFASGDCNSTEWFTVMFGLSPVMDVPKLNPDKTDFLLIGTVRQWSKSLSMFLIGLLGVRTNPAKSARNLAVIFCKNFTFRSHISAVCSSCFCHMQHLLRIRCHLDLDSAKLLATALVSSRLDYCNSLLYGIADIDLARL